MGLDGHGGQQGGLRLSVARQGLDGGDLADGEVRRGQVAAAPDVPLHEALEARGHLLAERRRDLEARLVGNGHHVGRQRVASRAEQGEVLQQPLAVEVGRQLAHPFLPEPLVAKGHGLRDLLLEAAVGVLRHVLPHAGKAVGDPRLHPHRDSAFAGHGAGGALHGNLDPVADLHEGGLPGPDGDGGDDPLYNPDAVLGPAVAFHGRDLVVEPVDAGGHPDVPADLLRLARREADVQRLVVGLLLSGRDGEPRLGVHGPFGRVADRDAGLQEVALAGQRRDAGQQLQVLRRADVGLPRAEEVGPARRDGDDPVLREAVLQGNLQARLAPAVQRHRRLPEKQRVEELAGDLLAAPASLRQGLEAEVPLADHHHLCRRGEDLVGPLPHHRVQELPARVGAQGEKAPVDGGHGQLRPLRQLLPGGRTDPEEHLRLLAHPVDRPVRLDLHGELVIPPARADLGDAQLPGGLAGVEGCRGSCGGRAPPDGEDRDEGVGHVVALHGDLHDGVGSRERLHVGVHDPLAFHRDQGRRLAEGHPHLQAGRFAGLVALLFGDQVDAVVVARLEPPVVPAGRPEAERRQGRVAVGVLRLGLQDHVARHGRRRLADEKPRGVRPAPAVRARFADRPLGITRRGRAGHGDPLDLGDVLVGVEPAGDPPAVRVGLALVEIDGNLHVGHGVAR